MNILFYSRHTFDPQFGGIERVSDILATELAHRGHNVSALILIADKASMVDTAYKVIHMPASLQTDDEKKRFITKVISDNRIEIVINQYALCYPETSLIPYGLNNCAFVSVLHSNPKLMLANFNDINKLLARNKAERFVRILLNPLLRLRYYNKRARYYQWLSSNSDAVVLLSSGYRHQFKALGNAIAIPNPAVVETYGDFGEKEHIVLYVGRMDLSQKRMDKLLRVWACLQNDSRAKGWRLILVGDGPDLSAIKKIAKDLKLKDVSFEGRQNPTPYYKKAAFVCLTSNYEGFPMVLAEAISHKCIPVSFDSYEAASDIINDGVDGVLVKPFNINEYAERLAQLMGNEAKRVAMAENSYKKSNQFDLSTIADKWEQLFRQLSKLRKQ